MLVADNFAINLENVIVLGVLQMISKPQVTLNIGSVFYLLSKALMVGILSICIVIKVVNKLSLVKPLGPLLLL